MVKCRCAMKQPRNKAQRKFLNGLMENTKEFRLLVCGSRDIKDVESVYRILDHLTQNKTNITVIQGGQVSFDKSLELSYGADFLSKTWAKSRGHKVLEFKADWKTHGKIAGPIRNSQQLTEGKPDACVAFFSVGSANRGTTDMSDKAKKAGIDIRKYYI